MKSINNLDRIYIGDSLISRIEIQLATSECHFLISYASLLREGESDIFNPERVYKPARLRFKDVESISCIEGAYYLNGTIVNFESVLISENRIKFTFQLTGGFDNDTFMRSLEILAGDLSIEDA